MKSHIDDRIAGKLTGDRNWSLAALAALWLLYAFVFWKMLPYAGTGVIFWSLAIGGGLVLLFNTASIIAMLAHLSEDRKEIYGLDLYYLDAARQSIAQPLAA